MADLIFIRIITQDCWKSPNMQAGCKVCQLWDADVWLSSLPGYLLAARLVSLVIWKVQIHTQQVYELLFFMNICDYSQVELGMFSVGTLCVSTSSFSINRNAGWNPCVRSCLCHTLASQDSVTYEIVSKTCVLFIGDLLCGWDLGGFNVV